jgi:N-acetylglucosamine-6-phosphate deacetylase
LNIYEIKNGWICPGLIDVHIHGGQGYDTMDGLWEAMQIIAEHLVQHGVTGFLATTMTGDLMHLENVVEQVAKMAIHDEALSNESSAQILGIHLEGLWINYDYKEAQNGDYVAHPTIEDARRIYEASSGWLRMVTMVPEQEDFEIIQTVVGGKVVYSST